MMKGFMRIEYRPEFLKDLKRLGRKFRTIDDDLRIFIDTQLFLFHKLNVDNKGVFRIQGLETTSPAIYKAKKFACRSLRGTGSRSGLRVIYAYFEEEDRIDLIEIYYKGDKKSEDRGRISRLYRDLRNR
jgi:mRNA-degrading endonuclease RelE of RelBE toxin-antitoxin system